MPPPPPTLHQPPVSQFSISPASSTSSIQDVTFALNSQFKPINPQPPSIPPVKPSIPQPQHSAVPTLQVGPVMDAIPASEALRSGGSDILSPEQGQFQNSSSKVYRPVYHHWFYKKGNKDKSVWVPFSNVDSFALEEAFVSSKSFFWIENLLRLIVDTYRRFRSR